MKELVTLLVRDSQISKALIDSLSLGAVDTLYVAEALVEAPEESVSDVDKAKVAEVILAWCRKHPDKISARHVRLFARHPDAGSFLRSIVDGAQQLLSPSVDVLFDKPTEADRATFVRGLGADRLQTQKNSAIGLRRLLDGGADSLSFEETQVAMKTVSRLGDDGPGKSVRKQLMLLLKASFGAEHPEVAIGLNNLASLLHATNRLEEAEPLMRRALAVDEHSYGTEHPNVARSLLNLAQLLRSTNRLQEAEPLMRRALAIDEQSYGTEHPNVARDLNNLAQLLQATNRLEEAEPLMRRALSIDESSYGVEHPNVAGDLNNLAQLLQATNRLEEAEPLMRRTIKIYTKFGKATGHEHPHMQTALSNYCSILQEVGLSEDEALAKIQAKLKDEV